MKNVLWAWRKKSHYVSSSTYQAYLYWTQKMSFVSKYQIRINNSLYIQISLNWIRPIEKSAHETRVNHVGFILCRSNKFILNTRSKFTSMSTAFVYATNSPQRTYKIPKSSTPTLFVGWNICRYRFSRNFHFDRYHLWRELCGAAI